MSSMVTSVIIVVLLSPSDTTVGGRAVSASMDLEPKVWDQSECTNYGLGQAPSLAEPFLPHNGAVRRGLV